jgi:penicillin-binding protein 1A
MERFGFDKANLPNNLSLALGSASLSPMQVATGFSVFANGGYQVFPYYLDELQDADGNTIFKANPVRVCDDCEAIMPGNEITPSASEIELTSNNDLEANTTSQNANLQEETEVEPDKKAVMEIRKAESVIEPRVNYIIDSILADVVKRGTGRKAMALGRNDLRGKTGTTNDQFDAWFTGYNGNIVASAWIGFDSPQTLGRGEFGATAALPVWLLFMEQALAEKEEKILPRPDKLVTVKINSKTGEAAKPGDPDAIFEIFREEFAPQLDSNMVEPSSNKEELDPTQMF